MNLPEAYRIMQENCGIHVGDRVKVLRKAKDYEMGWGNEWAPGMNELVGQIGIVTSVTEESGIQIGGVYWFPFFILEKVELPIPELTEAEVCKRLGYEVKIRKE